MKTFKTINSPRFGDTAGLDQGNEFAVSCVNRVSSLYTIYLDACIESPQDMRSACQVFAQAQQDDEVVVNLNTPGGSVDATQSFLLAANNCRAPVSYQASGTIASAGAIILSDAESYQLHPHSCILFHTASFGTYGPSIDNVEYSVFAKEQTEKFMSFYCAGILTKAELHEIFNLKKQMWITASDFNQRWARKQECREMLESLVEDGVFDADEAGPEDYVEWMLDLTDNYDNREGVFAEEEPEESTLCCGNESGCSHQGTPSQGELPQPLTFPEIVPKCTPEKKPKKKAEQE